MRSTTKLVAAVIVLVGILAQSGGFFLHMAITKIPKDVIYVEVSAGSVTSRAPPGGTRLGRYVEAIFDG